MTETYRFRLAVMIAVIAMGAVVPTTSGQASVNERTLFEFKSPDSAKGWAPINDNVMGGVSSGSCRRTESGTLEFSGKVSLENNGGFASARVSTNSLDLSAFDALVLRVRGDGKQYAISVQTDYPIMAGAYYFSFQSQAGSWQEIRAPIRAFEPRSFGRPLRGAPVLNAGDVRSLGFIISDKQEGPFHLEVDWIKAARTRQDNTPREEPVEKDKTQTASRLIRKAIGLGAPLFNGGQPEACAAIYEIAASCMVDLSADELPREVVETLRAGLAKAEQTTDPAARAWALRDALDTSAGIMSQDLRGKEASDDD